MYLIAFGSDGVPRPLRAMYVHKHIMHKLSGPRLLVLVFYYGGGVVMMMTHATAGPFRFFTM